MKIDKILQKDKVIDSSTRIANSIKKTRYSYSRMSKVLIYNFFYYANAYAGFILQVFELDSTKLICKFTLS